MSSLKKSTKQKSKLSKFYLKYFDWNNDGVTNWWEYLIPFGFILGVEILAEVIGLFLLKVFF